MRKLLILLAVLITAKVVSAELLMQTVTANTSSQTATLNAGEVLIINDDDDTSVWIRVFTTDETVAAATTAAPSVEIKFGEGFSFPRTTGVKAVTLITSSGTVSVRLIYW